MIYIFDSEVFRYDWLFVFKELDQDDWTVIYNDQDALEEFMNRHPWLCGFNNKHYDNHILRAALSGYEPSQIKEVSDQIIYGASGWTLVPEKISFDSFDLMDDCQIGLSLKAIEAHLGMPITESSIPFDIDRKLTSDEMQETIHYCKADVAATEKLYHLREGYLDSKRTVGEMAGISPAEALSMTNAKLTARFLGAVSPEQDRTDERAYQIPANLKTEYIPQEVLDFFDRMKDPSLSDEEVFGSKLDIEVGGTPCTIGFGGIHGALPNYREEATATRTIRNKDVASYYPNLMRVMGYCSRNMSDPARYTATIQRRIEAKKKGDRDTANSLKLVLNTTYGAMLNRFNPLYDPLMGRSVCISGQLYLLELARHLVEECKSLRIVQLNTDGIMVSLDDSDGDRWEAITEEWQKRTGFTLEEDFIRKIVQKDVNNYVEVGDGESVKLKGGMLVRGISPAGAFNVNNNAVVVAKALREYFVNGTPPEETINQNTEILSFQIVAKASSKYSAVYHLVNGERVPVQKVNRVYATKDQSYGTLVKVHAKRDGDAKVPGLPEHCLVDNDNQLTLDAIDKDWYIRLAKHQIKEFLGNRRNPDKRKLNRLKKSIESILQMEEMTQWQTRNLQTP